jgi:hypothetical protein
MLNDLQMHPAQAAGSCSFGIVLRLSITHGGSFVPSANTINITVTRIFSLFDFL